MKKNRRRNRQLLNCAGSTMVSVLVGFTIFAILSSVFARSLFFSQNLIAQANAFKENTDVLMNAFYLGRLSSESLTGGPLRMTVNGEEILLDTSIEKYDYNGSVLYTFGQHTVTSEN